MKEAATGISCVINDIAGILADSYWMTRFGVLDVDDL